MIALAVAVALTAAAPSTRMVSGQGTSSCGSWTEERRSEPMVAIGTTSWVLGYLTAYNAYVAKNGNVQGGADANAIGAWLDNYCAAHPLDDIDTATRALISDLKARGP